MKLTYSEIAGRQISTLAPQIKIGIREILEVIRQNPYCGKALQRDLAEFRSAPFKRYRIIYKVICKKKQIFIYLVEHREDIYENAARLLKETKNRQ